MAAIDGTVVGIALPTIGREWHASLASLQWVVSGYVLTLAALLILGGSLGDLYGRRKLFVIGVVWFAAASAACALAPDIQILVATRVLQGIGGALLVPGSLAILQATFDDEDRGRAIGMWSGLGGLATAAGPLVGGILIMAASWRWIFLINLPLGIAVLIVSLRRIPESRDMSATGHLDSLGAVLAVSTLAGVTFGLIEGPELGWRNGWVISMLFLGVLSAIAFVLTERASAAPMLPMTLFRLRNFTVTNLVTFIVYGALGGGLFLLPIQLQVSDGYSPVEAGLVLLPLTALMLFLSPLSGRLSTRYGPRAQMSLGPPVVGIGLVLLAQIGGNGSYGTRVLPAVLIFGLGLAITVTPLTATALSSVPDEHAGLASAVNNSVARLGGLIAVAVLPACAGITGMTYQDPSALSSGFRTALELAGILCFGAGAIAAAGIRNPSRPAAPDQEPDHKVSCSYCALDATPLVHES